MEYQTASIDKNIEQKTACNSKKQTLEAQIILGSMNEKANRKLTDLWLFYLAITSTMKRFISDKNDYSSGSSFWLPFDFLAMKKVKKIPNAVNIKKNAAILRSFFTRG